MKSSKLDSLGSMVPVEIANKKRIGFYRGMYVEVVPTYSEYPTKKYIHCKQAFQDATKTYFFGEVLSVEFRNDGRYLSLDDNKVVEVISNIDTFKVVDKNTYENASK